MINNTFKIYLSHQIRGPKGNNATEEDVCNNIIIHKNVGEQLKAYFLDWERMDGFPKIYLYVPADHDEFVQTAWKKKYLNESQILDVDCAIINTCDLVIAYGDAELSNGMRVEINYATTHNVPLYMMPSLSEMSIEALKFVIHLILESESD